MNENNAFLLVNSNPIAEWKIMTKSFITKVNDTESLAPP